MLDILALVEAFEELGVTYYIGGSVASSAYGLPRMTIDADIIAYLQMEHVGPLVTLLQDRYYIDAEYLRDAFAAVQNLTSFTLYSA